MATLQSDLKLGTQIGSGYFGKVFLADDPVHGTVAVKVLTASPGESPSEWQVRKAGLLSEAQLLKKAAHKHVVQVYNLLESTTSDAVHLVMEYCSGGSLQVEFESGPLPLYKVRDIATDISHGLSALHTRSMIHRDIKPANLLRDGKGIAKLADFGLVTDKLLYGYGSQAGYRDHIAFEVQQGTSGTSARSDIWAFGMTLYRLIHGADWYSRSPAPKTLIPNGNFAKKLTWLPHVPDSWRRFIRRTMHDDTKLRFQNTGQVQVALAKLPIEPRWACKVGSSDIRWKRTKGDRRVRVMWKRIATDQFEWEAWSEPRTGTGNRRTLGGSPKMTSYSQSVGQLEKFFESHT